MPGVLFLVQNNQKLGKIIDYSCIFGKKAVTLYPISEIEEEKH